MVKEDRNLVFMFVAEAGPTADPEASDSAPVSQDTVDIVRQTSGDSRNDSNAAEETGNTALALCLVSCLCSAAALLHLCDIHSYCQPALRIRNIYIPNIYKYINIMNTP